MPELPANETAAMASARKTFGATRYADLLKLRDLRFWPIKDFPYLIFYLERDAHIDIWRVLHAYRDIPAWIGH